MHYDPSFYLAAIPAVILVGLTKGGMGEALALMGVPILSLVVDPVSAAAIMLPILIVMDIVSLWIWRKHGDTQTLKIMLPGALLGIAFGWATSAHLPSYLMRLLIGAVAITFSGRFFYNRFFASHLVAVARPQNRVKASFWSAISGYGSFVAHAGGAPYQIYAMPLKLDPRTYTGTTVRFFAILNAIKLAPYFALGQLDLTNLKLSATLFPLAPIATVAGAMIVRRMRVEIFYPYMYLMAGLAGLKLFYDGMRPLVAMAF